VAVLMMFGIPSVFSTGSCYHHGCDDDDHHYDDHHHGCDDDYGTHHHAVDGRLPNSAGTYAIDRFQLIPSDDARRHPVAWLYQIEGVNPFHIETTSSDSELDFEWFTAMVILVNEELVGLPPSAGRLAFAEVEFTDGFEVRWIQETSQPDGTWQPVPQADLVFYFDPIGNLVTVQNRTWLRPPDPR